MVDGVQFAYCDPKNRLVGLSIWEVLTNELTGEKVDDVRTANVRGLFMQLKPSTKGKGSNLLLNGSLHRWHNGGEANVNDFTFPALYDTIRNLTDVLTISPESCLLHGLEVGVNIKLPFHPSKVLNNMVCYKGRPFLSINKREKAKGGVAALNEYKVKVYDKAAQSGQGCGHLLRVEIHIDKMRVLDGYGIKTLSDLQDAKKAYSLKTLLVEAVAGIVWTDRAVKISGLDNREQKQWLYLSNPKSWENMSKAKAYKERKKAVSLVSKHGSIYDMGKSVSDVWEGLFLGVFDFAKGQVSELGERGFPAKNGACSDTFRHEKQAQEKVTFSPLECTVKRSPFDNLEMEVNKAVGHNIENDNIIKKTFDFCTVQTVRKCKTCGGDISAQKPDSIFCSKKTTGEAAKRCRNKDSNRRHHMKTKLKKAMEKDRFVMVTYGDGAGRSYTDTLHPSELQSVPRVWFDRVQQIAILPTMGGEAGEVLAGKAAKEYIRGFVIKG